MREETIALTFGVEMGHRRGDVAPELQHLSDAQGGVQPDATAVLAVQPHVKGAPLGQLLDDADARRSEIRAKKLDDVGMICFFQNLECEVMRVMRC